MGIIGKVLGVIVVGVVLLIAFFIFYLIYYFLLFIHKNVSSKVYGFFTVSPAILFGAISLIYNKVLGGPSKAGFWNDFLGAISLYDYKDLFGAYFSGYNFMFVTILFALCGAVTLGNADICPYCGAFLCILKGSGAAIDSNTYVKTNHKSRTIGYTTRTETTYDDGVEVGKTSLSTPIKEYYKEYEQHEVIKFEHNCKCEFCNHGFKAYSKNDKVHKRWSN